MYSFCYKNEVEAKQRERRRRTREGEYRSRASDGEDSGRFTDRGNFAYNSEDTSNGGSWNLLGLTHLIPKVRNCSRVRSTMRFAPYA